MNFVVEALPVVDLSRIGVVDYYGQITSSHYLPVPVQKTLNKAILSTPTPSFLYKTFAKKHSPDWGTETVRFKRYDRRSADRPGDRRDITINAGTGGINIGGAIDLTTSGSANTITFSRKPDFILDNKEYSFDDDLVL